MVDPWASNYDDMNVAGPDSVQSVLEGHQPLSRVGEVVCNAYADRQAFMKQQLDAKFSQWGSVVPGTICLQQRETTKSRSYMNESAMPVVTALRSNMVDAELKTYSLAGICRSGSKLEGEHGRAEIFTVRLRGQDSVVNSTGAPLCPGDVIAWTAGKVTAGGSASKMKRVQIKKVHAEEGEDQFKMDKTRIIGRVLHYSAAGKPVDILLNEACMGL